MTARAIKYLDLHGKPVTACFNDGSKHGAPHVVFKNADNQTVLSPKLLGRRLYSGSKTIRLRRWR